MARMRNVTFGFGKYARWICRAVFRTGIWKSGMGISGRGLRFGVGKRGSRGKGLRQGVFGSEFFGGGRKTRYGKSKIGTRT